MEHCSKAQEKVLEENSPVNEVKGAAIKEKDVAEVIEWKTCLRVVVEGKNKRCGINRHQALCFELVLALNFHV